tara:strand:+ start:34871 stop:35977 length:1107 start_codon:yes stop_codon:yes gene_type:complete
MISKLTRFFVFIFVFTFSISNGQNNTYFSISAGTNIIDNSNGNEVPWDIDRAEFKTPFFIEVERRFNDHIAVSVMGTTNTFQLDRLNAAGDGFDTNSYNFLAFDIAGKFYFDDYLFDTDNIDLYAGLGLGYHDVAEGDALTANLNLGFNYWFTDRFGLSFQAIGKKGIGEEILYVGNYYQYNLGASYRFAKKSVKKKADVVPEIKLVPDAPVKEEPAVIANVPVSKPASKPTETPAVAVSQADLELQTLQAELDALEPVYFDKNSSFIGNSEKTKLDAIIGFLSIHTDLYIKIDSYTDDTGTEAYNNWLSGRRLERVTKYMIAEGINPKRLDGTSHGIDSKNSCNADHTNCSEDIHQLQRRVEFTIRD